MRYGFDGPFMSNNCHINYAPGKCFYWDETGKKVFFQEWEPYGQTHQALEFIDRAPKDKPFALFMSWHPPHDNKKIKGDPYPFGYDAPEELLAKYDPKTLRLRPNVDDTPTRRLQYQGHMAMITGIDIAFGWLLEKLKERGLEKNTLVVFTKNSPGIFHRAAGDSSMGACRCADIERPSPYCFRG